ncbi:MAG: hypothetical protein DSM106950_15260 [Stigonema ocellatum SAG 48.90 = DSM 106950]|nr:hypothetical protein [Stigonema ocellatum SAG 48.90 = DSM 106950]
MNKFLLYILLSATAISTLPILPNLAQSAKKTPIQQNFSWTKIFLVLFGKKPPVQPRKGGSRPIVDICMVSPDAPPEGRIVWSDRPVFIWKGSVQKIAVRPVGSEEDMWSQSVGGIQRTNYTGKALQPGQRYDWLVFDGESPNKFVSFQVMDAQQRDRITTQLRTLEKRLKAKGVNTEAIATAKANFFADRQLWSDVLQQAYSVEKPSPELDRIRKDIPDQLCNTQQTVGSNSPSR